ncbi:MAG TPA: hypothetical protein DD766_07215, partial [Desulfovibrio sp.]|nr:hypothetical protein [Desulfovibrio sp.]
MPARTASLPWSAARSLLLAALCLALLLALPAAAAPTTAVKRGLVVLVQFPDVSHDLRRDFVQQRFSGFLNTYVQEMSFGAVSLDVEVTPDWITLPEPVSSYRIPPQNLKVDKSRVARLIDDALSRVDPGLDLSAYDFIALMLGAKMQEYGMVGLCGYPGMLGWSSEGPFTTKSGRVVRSGVAIFTSQAHPGTLFHDVAHVLGGV